MGTPTREEVRALVAKNHAALVAAARQGEQVHQLALDQRDIVNARMREMEPQAAQLFALLYDEEMLAANKAAEDEAARVQARIEQADMWRAEAKAAEQIKQAERSFRVSAIIPVLLGLLAFAAYMYAKR